MQTLLSYYFADTVRKNKNDLLALVRGTYPDFVYRRTTSLPQGTIPVFVFHSVEPTYFEEQLCYLVDNHYETIKADELLDIIVGRKRPRQNTIALTFDDGTATLWSVAYPLLKKYGCVATSFVIPFHIQEEESPGDNMENVRNKSSEVNGPRRNEEFRRLCTWAEIREMQASGVVDFQSHTSHHNSVFTDATLCEFVSPTVPADFLSGALFPVIRKKGIDTFLNTPEWGQPIYTSAPALAAQQRYLEDEVVSEACIDFVKRHGSEAFFRKGGWRRELSKYYSRFTKTHGIKGVIQPLPERIEDIRHDLSASKSLIQSQLNKPVWHLCLPWYEGSDLALIIAKQCGYECVYWGIHANQSINVVGSDPYRVVRMSEDYIMTLPGRRRIGLDAVLLTKLQNRIRAKGLKWKTMSTAKAASRA